MIPLLRRDGCELAAWALLGIWWLAATESDHHETRVMTRAELMAMRIRRVSYTAMMLVQLLDWTMAPPARYPHLWIVANVVISCGVFVLSYGYLVWRVWVLSGWMDSGARKTNTRDAMTRQQQVVEEDRRQR